MLCTCEFQLRHNLHEDFIVKKASVSSGEGLTPRGGSSSFIMLKKIRLDKYHLSMESAHKYKKKFPEICM